MKRGRFIFTIIWGGKGRKGLGKSRGKYDISIYDISKYDISICMCMVCMLSQLFNKRSKTGGSKGKRSSLINFL